MSGQLNETGPNDGPREMSFVTRFESHAWIASRGQPAAAAYVSGVEEADHLSTFQVGHRAYTLALGNDEFGETLDPIDISYLVQLGYFFFFLGGEGRTVYRNLWLWFMSYFTPLFFFFYGFTLFLNSVDTAQLSFGQPDFTQHIIIIEHTVEDFLRQMFFFHIISVFLLLVYDKIHSCYSLTFHLNMCGVAE